MKFRVTAAYDQCECILDYCSTDVQGFIRASEHYQNRHWPKLRKEILKCYDADRATSRYKPSDIATYTLKTQARPFQNLSQWKRYFIKYKTMAGTLFQQGHITKLNYDVYFLLGIEQDLRRTLEQRIMQMHPSCNNQRHYSVREINEAAEWFFRRNRAETMVINAADYRVDLDDESTDEEDREDASGEDSDDSDYEIYRWKHRAKMRAKKEKERSEKRKKKTKKTELGSQAGKTSLGNGTTEEVSSLIRQLNKMSITDPEYLPVFYKVLALDTTGNAAKCVQPPRLDGTLPASNVFRTRDGPVGNTGGGGSGGPATYPNNIPLGTASVQKPENVGCFGCHKEGHRINDCADLQELIKQSVVYHDEESRRLRMKDGTFIRRINGESLVQAAQRLAAVPRVMFVTVDSQINEAREHRGHCAYTTEQAFIENLEEMEDELEYLPYGSDQEEKPLDTHWYAAEDKDLEDGDSLPFEEVYLTVPRNKSVRMSGGQVNSADRTVPSTQAARREVFDGIHIPWRPRPMTAREDQKKGENTGFERKSVPQKARDLLPEL